MQLATLFTDWNTAWNHDLGWALVLVGIAWGAVLGLGFQRADFLGGYDSFPRRLLRLGHVACIALGGANVLWSVVAPVRDAAGWGGVAWAVGALCMPTVCALSAWNPRFRHAFPIPVLAVVAGALNGLLS